MPSLADHPLRYSMVNELHARPFPRLDGPGVAQFLAIKAMGDAARRDKSQDRAHLIALLDRFGVSHPQPGATHYFGSLGKYELKWEQHREFVTYTLFSKGEFQPAEEVFPKDWLAAAPGKCMTWAVIEIVLGMDTKQIETVFSKRFESESLATSYVLDKSALVAGDFRINAQGHTHFAVFADEKTGSQRIGRIVQRVCEIEIYKCMAMLGLARAHKLSAGLGQVDADLSRVVDNLGVPGTEAEATLVKLLDTSAQLESLVAEASFRFAATAAYGAIVSQRIQVLREERFEGRQTIHEFMMRRFDPAIRTVTATEAQMAALSSRAMRAADLLRTRVEVERAAQNQTLLASMDARAGLQLRLQQTVEGLSVVAISYYAVNLLSYLLTPIMPFAGKPLVQAALVIPVLALSFFLLQRIKKKHTS